MDRVVKKNGLLPALKAYDGLLAMAENLQAPNQRSARGQSRTRAPKSSSATPTLTTEFQAQLKNSTIWTVLHSEYADLSNRKANGGSALTFQPADACAAVGCESLGVPQTVCSDCKKVFYCGRECQRR